MKLNEIEKTITTKGFTETLFLDYIKALKRVPGNSLRCQHCYITALEMQSFDFDNAIRMIHFGLENYAETWLDHWRSNRNLVILYEKREMYDKVKDIYLLMISSLDETKQVSVIIDIYFELLKTEMHLNGFNYSAELEEYYGKTVLASEFQQQFRHFIFYKSIAEMINYDHSKDRDSFEMARINAIQSLDGNKQTVMDRLLKRHRYANETHATKQATRFLFSKKFRV